MAIEITCNDCGNKYRVSDEKAGAKVRCKECGSRIDVPDGDDFELQRPSRSRSGSRGKRKGNSSPPPGVIIGVGVVAAICVIGVVLFAVLGRRGAPAGQIAQNVPAAALPNSTPTGGTLPAAPGSTAAPSSALPTSPSAPPASALPSSVLPASALPSSPPEGGFPSSTPPAPGAVPGAPAGQPGAPGIGQKFAGFGGAVDNNDGVGEAPAAENWNVKVDPSQQETKIDSAKPVSVKFPKGSSNADVVYPATPSVFVAVGSNGLSQQVREVWNLATRAKLGAVTNNLVHPGAMLALSPDGQFFAASMVFQKKEGIRVWAVKGNKPLVELETESKVSAIRFASPERLIGVCDNETARVWTLPTGKVEHDIPIGKSARDGRGVVVSPGGNYLAFVEDKSTLKVFDFTKGEVTGECSLPFGKDFFAGVADSMSFSPDGVELAIVMPTGVSEYTFVLFNVADGKLLTKVKLDAKNISNSASRVDGNRLEWFPDRTKLLWLGHYVLDAKIGGPVWSAPEESSSGTPRKLLDEKRILVSAGDGLKAAPVPLSEIVAAAKVVAEGGEASDAGMPALMKADISGAVPIAPTATAGWTMKPDPTPGSAKTVKTSLPLPRNGPSMGGAFIARPNVGRAVVWYTDDFHAMSSGRGISRHSAGPRNNTGVSVIDSFDLATGKYLGEFPLNYPNAILDVSPDGDFVAVKTTKPNAERIDVYSIRDGKPIAGWRPYQRKEDHFKEVTEALLIDGEYCLTRNFSGATIMWKLPEGKAVWRMDGGSNFCLSPGGTYLGFRSDSRFVFMNPRTGELVGDVSTTMSQVNCAFHPLGTHFALLNSDFACRKIMVIDVATGQSTADFYVPQGNNFVQWCGDTSLLVDGKWLVDLTQKKNAWSYLLPHGVTAVAQPDGRYWFVTGAGPFDQNLFLSVVNVPDKTASAQIAAAQLPDESLLKPGMQINLQVNLGAASPTHPNLAADITKSFRAGMEKHGFQVGAGSPYSFVISTTQSNPGGSMEFRPLGRGIGGAMTTVPITNVECLVTLQANGQVIWKTNATLSNRTFGIQFLKDGEDITTHLTKQLGNSVANYFLQFQVPGQAFPDTAGAGLGKSTFVPGGTQPATN